MKLTKIPTNPIVSTICVFVLVLVVLHIIRTFEKQQEKFSILASQYLVNTDMYPNEHTCLDLVEKLNSPELSRLSEAERTTLQSFKNNTYVADNKVFGTGQCIIPTSQMEPNRILANCLIENSPYTLEQNNITRVSGYPTPTNAEWTFADGCVLNKNTLMYNLKNVMTAIEANKTREMQNANSLLSGATSANTTQAKQLDNTTTKYNDEAGWNRYYTSDAKSLKQQEDYKASLEETKSATILDQASQYNLDGIMAKEFNEFLDKKLVGIRWYAFEGYFQEGNVESANRYLDNIWAGKIIPYDGGMIDKIDNYEGMTDINADYKHNSLTNNVTYVWEFLFRPDMDGKWSFELGSDDGSFLCMWNNDQSFVEPSVTSIFGTNVNFFKIQNPGSSSPSTNSSYMMTIDNGGNHGFITKVGETRESLKMGNMYKVMIVQGNHNGGGGNYQGCRLRVKRPNSIQWYVLTNGEAGIGAQEPTNWKNKYMAFCHQKKGMFAKVYEDNYNDKLDFFRNRKPIAAVRLREAYNMNQAWVGSTLPGHGINMTRSWADRPELIRSRNNNSANPTQEPLYLQGFENWPWWWEEKIRAQVAPSMRTISFFGYFKAPETGNYKFFFSGDDAVYIWFGLRSKERIVSGLDNSFDVSQGAAAGTPGFMQSIPGKHGPESRPIVVNLDAGSITPIRFVHGDGGGWSTIVFGYELRNGEPVYDLTRDFFF
jgi:hypothetical protein